MPACSPWRGSRGNPARPVFISTSSRPSRGAKPRGVDDRKLPQEQPHHAGSRGGHDDRDQAGAGLCSVLVSPVVQRGQAQAKVSGKGYHSGATRPRPAGQPDGGHHGAQDSVITSAFGSRRPPLVRITCTRCSPLKWPIVGTLPAHYLGRGPWPLQIELATTE